MAKKQTKNKLYFADVSLFYKGKNYGGKRTQIGGSSVADVRKKLKQKYAFKSKGVDNVVRVTNIMAFKKAKEMGFNY